MKKLTRATPDADGSFESAKASDLVLARYEEAGVAASARKDAVVITNSLTKSKWMLTCD